MVGPKLGRTYINTPPVIPILGNHNCLEVFTPYRDVMSHFVNLFNKVYDHESSSYSLQAAVHEVFEYDGDTSVSITSMAVFMDALTTHVTSGRF